MSTKRNACRFVYLHPVQREFTWRCFTALMCIWTVMWICQSGDSDIQHKVQLRPCRSKTHRWTPTGVSLKVASRLLLLSLLSPEAAARFSTWKQSCYEDAYLNSPGGTKYRNKKIKSSSGKQWPCIKSTPFTEISQ